MTRQRNDNTISLAAKSRQQLQKVDEITILFENMNSKKQDAISQLNAASRTFRRQPSCCMHEAFPALRISLTGHVAGPCGACNAESVLDLGARHLERRSKVHPLPLFAPSEDAVSIPGGLKYHEGYGQRLGESTFDVRRPE
jgi:hypothetical protein